MLCNIIQPVCSLTSDLCYLENIYFLSNMYLCLQGWLHQKSSFTSGSNGEMDLESLALLLKCMKIMENATFLSKDNQVKIKVKGTLFSYIFPSLDTVKLH